MRCRMQISLCMQTAFGKGRLKSGPLDAKSVEQPVAAHLLNLGFYVEIHAPAAARALDEVDLLIEAQLGGCHGASSGAEIGTNAEAWRCGKPSVVAPTDRATSDGFAR